MQLVPSDLTGELPADLGLRRIALHFQSRCFARQGFLVAHLAIPAGLLRDPQFLFDHI